MSTRRTFVLNHAAILLALQESLMKRWPNETFFVVKCEQKPDGFYVTLSDSEPERIAEN